MGSETARLLAILHNGSDAAVLDNASEIAAELRRMAARIADLEAENPRAAALLRAVEGLDRHSETFTCGFIPGADDWHVGMGTHVAVSAVLSTALIALAGEVANGS